MPEPKDIVTLKPTDEIRVCPSCGYTYGFHTSFISVIDHKDRPIEDTREMFRVILICPECGARYDVGWRVSFTDPDNRVLKTIEIQQLSP